jgi:hypothetical protein
VFRWHGLRTSSLRLVLLKGFLCTQKEELTEHAHSWGRTIKSAWMETRLDTRARFVTRANYNYKWAKYDFEGCTSKLRRRWASALA